MGYFQEKMKGIKQKRPPLISSLAILALLSHASCSHISTMNKHQKLSVGEENHELVDMGAMGERISTLQMSMLNKRQAADSQDEVELSPSDDQMLLLGSHVDSNQRQGSHSK